MLAAPAARRAAGFAVPAWRAGAAAAARTHKQSSSSTAAVITARRAASSGISGGDDWVDAALIQKTAGLAQLELTPAEAEALVPRVRSFLGFVAAMDAVDAADGEAPRMPAAPREGVGEGGFLREDAPLKFPNDDAIVANMPAREGRYLRVERVGAEEP